MRFDDDRRGLVDPVDVAVEQVALEPLNIDLDDEQPSVGDGRDQIVHGDDRDAAAIVGAALRPRPLALILDRVEADPARRGADRRLDQVRVRKRGKVQAGDGGTVRIGFHRDDRRVRKNRREPQAGSPDIGAGIDDNGALAACQLCGMDRAQAIHLAQARDVVFAIDQDLPHRQQIGVASSEMQATEAGGEYRDPPTPNFVRLAHVLLVAAERRGVAGDQTIPRGVPGAEIGKWSARPECHPDRADLSPHTAQELH